MIHGNSESALDRQSIHLGFAAALSNHHIIDLSIDNQSFPNFPSVFLDQFLIGCQNPCTNGCTTIKSYNSMWMFGPLSGAEVSQPLRTERRIWGSANIRAVGYGSANMRAECAAHVSQHRNRPACATDARGTEDVNEKYQKTYWITYLCQLDISCTKNLLE